MNTALPTAPAPTLQYSFRKKRPFPSQPEENGHTATKNSELNKCEFLVNSEGIVTLSTFYISQTAP